MQMQNQEFEVMLEREEKKIQELKAAMHAKRVCRDMDSESKYSTTPLIKFNERIKTAYDETQKDETKIRTRTFSFTRILMACIFSSFFMIICITLFLRHKEKEESKKITEQSSNLHIPEAGKNKV